MAASRSCSGCSCSDRWTESNYAVILLKNVTYRPVYVLSRGCWGVLKAAVRGQNRKRSRPLFLFCFLQQQQQQQAESCWELFHPSDKWVSLSRTRRFLILFPFRHPRLRFPLGVCGRGHRHSVLPNGPSCRRLCLQDALPYTWCFVYFVCLFVCLFLFFFFLAMNVYTCSVDAMMILVPVWLANRCKPTHPIESEGVR